MSDNMNILKMSNKKKQILTNTNFIKKKINRLLRHFIYFKKSYILMTYTLTFLMIKIIYNVTPKFLVSFQFEHNVTNNFTIRIFLREKLLTRTGFF